MLSWSLFLKMKMPWIKVLQTSQRRESDDADRDEGPPARPDQGLKRKKTCKETDHQRRPSQLEPPKAPPNLSQNLLENLHKQRRQCLRLEILKCHRILEKTRSYIDLEYNMEECYKTLTDQLDWNNPEGESTGRTYTTSLNKTKAAKYELPGIEDMVPNLRSLTKVAYDKHALLGTSHWEPKRQRFYEYASKRVSKHDVYSTKRILAVTNVKVKVWYGYGHLEEIGVRRSHQQLYKIMKGDFLQLHLKDTEDMLLLVKRVEDHQLGFESYQKKLNISKPRTREEDLSRRAPYTTLSDPQGVIYEDKLNRKRLIRSNELYKFSDGTLQSVQDTFHDMATNLKMGYNKAMPKRRFSHLDKTRSYIMVKEIDHQLQKRSDEVLKLKSFKKDENTSFQEQEMYEHVGPKVTSTQDGKRSQDDDSRLCLADDLKDAQNHMQVKLKGTSSSLKSKDHYTYHKMKDKYSSPRAKTEEFRRMRSLRFLQDDAPATSRTITPGSIRGSGDEFHSRPRRKS
nr:hypothetical protein [Tanacetum cinerariifolium]